jgi:hypothetical protein
VAGLCKAFPAAAPGASEGAGGAGGLPAPLGYALAGAGDDATTVADAVVAACSAPLSRWNQQALSADGAARGAQPADRRKHQPDRRAQQLRQGRALFYVVQARAGGCKPPPKREGATMTTPEA